MQIGLGLDATLGLDLDDQKDLSRRAAELGYTSLWTPEGTGVDSFQLCNLRWQASSEVVAGGIGTGISVSPVAYRTPVAFAMAAGTASLFSGGKFTLGIGTGSIYRPRFRRDMGLPTASAVETMRDYVTIIRKLLAGETVNYEGPVVTLRNAQLQMRPPATPVYLGALGPRMLELAGEVADGAALNWCSPEQIAWSRERIDAGAAAAGRDPREIQMAEYIRICVDDDPEVARTAYIRSMMGYALGMTVPTERERAFGYRAHFERMGYTAELGELDRMRTAGASADELVAAFPDDLALAVGYFGTPDGAREAFMRLAQGLDTAIVRVVAARPERGSVEAVMEACSPSRSAA